MKKIKQRLLSSSASIVVGTTVLTLSLAERLVSAQFIEDAQKGIENIEGDNSPGTVPDILQNVVNLLLFLVGAFSVIMLIIAGFRFVMSAGDTQGAANARNMVLYSVIGLIVAVSAYGIASWVLGRLYPTPTPANIR